MRNGLRQFVVWSVVVLVVVTVLVVKGQLDQSEATDGVSKASHTFFGLIGAAFSGVWDWLFD